MMDKKKTEGVPEHILSAMPRARVEIFMQVVLITLVTIGVFAGIGYFLDTQFGTQPILFVIGVFVSFPFTQIFLLRKVRQLGLKQLQEGKK